MDTGPPRQLIIHCLSPSMIAEGRKSYLSGGCFSSSYKVRTCARHAAGSAVVVLIRMIRYGMKFEPVDRSERFAFSLESQRDAVLEKRFARFYQSPR